MSEILTTLLNRIEALANDNCALRHRLNLYREQYFERDNKVPRKRATSKKEQ
jgi:hypothetical protein